MPWLCPSVSDRSSEQDARAAGDALAFADVSEPLVGACGDADCGEGQPERARDVLAHPFDVRGKTGALGKDGDARVAGRKPLPADEPHDLGEQFHAVCACKPRVRVGEIVPDVPQSRRRKEGVHQRVYEDVAVRMRREPVRVRDDGAAARWMVRYEREGKTAFRTVDFRSESQPALP